MLFGETLCLLLAVSLHCSLGSSQCAPTKINEGEITDICCHKKEELMLFCSRNTTLVMKGFFFKVHGTCKGNECCKNIGGVDIYNIRQCRRMSESDTLAPAMTEVLKECSQKKYCVLANEEGSYIQNLKNYNVQGGKYAVSLTTTHTCIDDMPTLSFCRNGSAYIDSRKSAYISTRGVTLSDDMNCTCDVFGPANVTLLDVRLGQSPENELLVLTEKNITCHRFSGGKDSLYLDDKIDISESEWELQLSVNKHPVPESVWIKLEGNQVSEVRCHEVQMSVSASDQKPTETNQNMKSCNGFSPYVIFVAGFVIACIGIVVVMATYSRLKRNLRQQSIPPSDYQEVELENTRPNDDVSSQSENDYCEYYQPVSNYRVHFKPDLSVYKIYGNPGQIKTGVVDDETEKDTDVDNTS